MKKFRYSEIFRSIQGEGHYTGIPTLWYRAWGCNFECKGFGSDDPQNVKLEDLPYMQVDVSQITKMEDLPVFSHGCDSSYSWSKQFGHLAHHEDAETIANKLLDMLPGRTWKHPQSGQQFHMAFTGGEPMMSQTAIVDIMGEWMALREWPDYVTIETNGTQKLRPTFVEFFEEYLQLAGEELFWSVSPKLSASGEKWEKAIRPDVVKGYNRLSSAGQLKYVVDGTQAVWDEVERATETYRSCGIEWPVWIMPVGALKESQEEVAGEIADQAIERGYNVAARVHCFLFGNKLGT